MKCSTEDKTILSTTSVLLLAILSDIISNIIIMHLYMFVFVSRYLYLSFKRYKLTGAHGVMVIIVGNGHGDTGSNSGRDWLYFT